MSNGPAIAGSAGPVPTRARAVCYVLRGGSRGLGDRAPARPRHHARGYCVLMARRRDRRRHRDRPHHRRRRRCLLHARSVEQSHRADMPYTRDALRSASTSTLVILSTRRTTLGDRAFPMTAARAWNALPSSVRSVPSSLLQFRRLFQSSYSSS